MKIAIIGAGISGLGAAYLLNQDPNTHITLYEKNNYIGGHSRTLDITTPEGSLPVDTGFIVFNDRNYPNLMGLFHHINVPYQKSDMAFGVSIDNGWLEYSSNSMFAQKRNLLRPAFYNMIANILRFNTQALRFIETDPTLTLGDCLTALKMGQWFQRYYLLAMGAAIWSCPLETILHVPASTFLRFFNNHGLLSINNRPQWYTVTGGSRTYVNRIIAHLHPEQIRLNTAIRHITPGKHSVTLHDTHGATTQYDQVIFACHADEALALIGDVPAYRKILGQFRYQTNAITVHSDTSFMPRNRKCWSSWVYLSDTHHDKNPAVSLSYWMNSLQALPTQTPILVTLNPGRPPKDNSIYDAHSFSHPIFDTNAINAQKALGTLQGQNGLWFCGAYQRYGFHEDGLLSAVTVAKAIGAHIPWH